MTRFKSLGGSILFVLLSLGVVFSTSVPLDGQSAREKVLIRAAKPYAALEAQVVALGGTVTHKFKKLDAIAAEIPESAIQQLRSSLPANAISKDEIIAAPGPLPELPGRGTPFLEDAEQVADGSALDAEALTALAETNPSAYTVNNGITHVNVLHGAGFTGSGMVVAVIDSGIRPGFPHISLDGSVVGCEDFVPDALGCSASANNSHGTLVAGMISANVIFPFSPLSPFRNAVVAHAPGAFADPGTNLLIPMIGSAPLAGIYALRVFGATGGAATSTILAAMERAIELRELFDASLPGGADIRVVNMSLGGSTIYAGRDLFDTLLNTLLDADIVPVIAAGNTGPALLTTGSPGSAFSALTVGAASFTHNERILRELQFGPGLGALVRPFNGHQTATFSSRGPNADGRPDPDVMANGFASYGQGSGGPGNISLVSGTSFATPTVAGVATVLRQAFPAASAIEIRNAIIAGADPGVITDGSSEFDQGAGMVNAVASYNLLAAGTVSDSLEKPHNPKKKVEKNLEKFGGLDVQSGNVAENSGLLLPGQHHTILYNVAPGTAQVLIGLSNFQQSGPGNTLFGDDILFAVHSAKTSSIGSTGDYPLFGLTLGGNFVVNNPEPGIMRVTLYGDWTNKSMVSIDATVSSIVNPLPPHSATGNLRSGEFESFVANIPAGTANVQFLLQWQEDWGRYPSADLDLLLVSPSNTLVASGATLNSPERATLTNPAPGNWTIIVDGFEVHLNKANYTLTMIRDGVVVKLK